MKNIYFSLLAIVVFIPQSCTSSTHVQVLKPADINLPDSIQKFAIGNRSLPAEGQKLGNIVEGLFSGEGIGLDKRASGSAVVGLTNGLAKSPRYDVTQINEQLYGTGTSQMPAPIEWSEVERLCQNANSDALILLETFDTDSKRSFDTKIRKRKVNDEYVEYTEHIANLDMRVTTGWRIYHPASRQILDNHVFEDHKGFTGRADNQELAIAKLPGKEQGAREAGIVAGESYAVRISPMWMDVHRDYFTKGSADMKMASRRARSNDWVGAAQIWRKLGDASANMKVKKRACYNMALACEIEGNLDLAIEWAKKARDLGMNRAINRINQLEQRKADDARANDQMN